MRRRKKQNLASDLVALPWQLSAGLAVGVFAGMRWVLPSVLGDSPLMSALKPLLAPLSWVALAVFGVLALASALRAALSRTGAGPKAARPKRRASEPMTTPRTETAPPTAHLPAPPSRWSLDALRTLEWKRFELLCAKYYEAVGFRTETLEAGPDGGIDVKLFKIDPSKPLAIVQCKAWNNRQVGVKEIRELLGVMAHTQVGRGIFATTGTYTQDALAFGAANPIQLLDGAAFLAKLLDLPAEKQAALIAFAFEGDYQTPTCASCGVKMLARDSKRGAFWGCMHYPRCKTLLPMRA